MLRTVSVCFECKRNVEADVRDIHDADLLTRAIYRPTLTTEQCSHRTLSLNVTRNPIYLSFLKLSPLLEQLLDLLDFFH